MLRSMFAGVSGLRGHQVMMDVVGNNIANVNTAGFKGSNAVFQDLLSQVLSGGGAPGQLRGGTNPAQVGLGSRLASIQTNFGQGALQVTGRSTDVAIQGDGFFMVNVGGQQLYTRAGNFDFDGNGNLVTPDGGRVQGWMANPQTGQINANGPTGPLTMPPGQLLAPVQTTGIGIGNMLNAGAAIGATVSSSITAYDAQGIENDIRFTFEKTANNEWTIEAFDNSGTSLGTNVLEFDPSDGNIASQSQDPWELTPGTGTWNAPITIDFGDPATDANALREFGGSSTAGALGQNGSEAGTLQSFNIADNGVITGVFSNGGSQTIGQLALANFNNPAGLEKAGGSNYRVTPNSGQPQVGAAGEGGRGGLAAGSLEMSNVDLAQEFTNLIIAQRGFQANSKMITASDEILQDLLSMKR
jgi:flagellar hook protein FlgE